MEKNTYELLEQLRKKLEEQHTLHCEKRDQMKPEDSFTEYGYECGVISGLLFAEKQILFAMDDLITEQRKELSPEVENILNNALKEITPKKEGR